MSSSGEPITPRFGEEGLVEVSGLLDITDKLDEATFFLSLMRQEQSLERIRWLTSACLTACRSALDWLAWTATHGVQEEEGELIPDEDALAILGKYVKVESRSKRGRGEKVFSEPLHRLLREMAAHRQETAHRSSLWIDRVSGDPAEALMYPGDAFAFVDFDPADEWFILCVPGRRVCAFCGEVIGLIQSIADEMRRA